jgi:hypothetical protein
MKNDAEQALEMDSARKKGLGYRTKEWARTVKDRGYDNVMVTAFSLALFPTASTSRSGRWSALVYSTPHSLLSNMWRRKICPKTASTLPSSRRWWIKFRTRSVVESADSFSLSKWRKWQQLRITRAGDVKKRKVPDGTNRRRMRPKIFVENATGN